MFRQSLEIERLHMGHRSCSHEARSVRDGRTRPEVKKNTITGNRPRASFVKADFNGLRSYESRFAANQFRSG